MSDNIFTILNKHPKLAKLMHGPYWNLDITDCDGYNVELRTEGRIKANYLRFDMTIEELDACLTDIENIIESSNEIAINSYVGAML